MDESVPISKSRNPNPSDPSSPSSHPVMNPNSSFTSHGHGHRVNPKPSGPPSSTASIEEESGIDGSENKKPKAVPVTFDPTRSGSGSGSGSQKGKPILRAESESETETEKKRKRKRKGKGPASASASASEEKEKEKEQGQLLLKEKSPFRRIWSCDDELTILKGMAEFLSDEDPSSIDMVAFHEFIRPSLKLKEVSRKQLRDKIHKLKVQYEAAAMRNITDPHEKKAYELYKRIWKRKQNKKKQQQKDNPGHGHGHGATVDNNAAPAAAAQGQTSYPLLKEALNQMSKFGLNFLVAEEMDVLEHVDDSKKAIVENKFKKMRLDGIKFSLRLMDLYKEFAKIILDSLSTPDG